MKPRFIASAALVALMIRPLFGEEPPVRNARVTNASGQVMIKTTENPKEAVAMDEETPLETGDVIETGPKSYVEITMDGDTVFTLQSNSRFKVSSLYLRNTQIELFRGAILAKVKPVTDPEAALILKMPTAVVAVRGTEFGAETGDGLSHVGIFNEGHVVVAGAWGHEHVILGPNQETKVPLSNVPQPPRRLSHFKTYRTQMAHVRDRAVYWHKNWKPISNARTQEIRERLSNPHRPKSQGFRQPIPPHRAPPKIHRKKHDAQHKRRKNRD